MEQLCEVPESIIRIVPLGSYSLEGEQRLAVFVIAKHSILIINGDNGSLIYKYDFKKFHEGITDCIYVASKRIFIALLEDGSLVSCEENSSVNDTIKEKWTLKPLKLLAVEDQVLVLCEGGYICKVSITNKSLHFPISPPLAVMPHNSDATDYHISQSSSHITLVLKTRYSDQARKKAKSDSVKKSECVTNDVIIWEIEKIKQHSWITADHGRKLKLAVDAGRLVAYVFVPSDGSCAHILHHNSDQEGSAEWMKISLHNEQLFNIPLNCTLHHVEFHYSNLYITDEKKNFVVYEGRYGRRVCNLPLPSSLASAPKPIVLAVDTTSSSQTQVYYGLKSSIEGGYMLYKKDIDCAPFTSLSTLLSSQEDAPLPILKSKASKRGQAILSMLSEESRQAMLELLGKYHKRVCQEADYEKTKKTLGAGGKSRKRKICSTETNHVKASRSYLSFVLQHIEDVQSMDWEYIKACIRNGDVTMSSHSPVFYKAYAQHRYDVLSEIVRCVVDVDEEQIVQILHDLFIVQESVLKSYIIFGCTIWNSDIYSYNAKERSIALKTSTTDSKIKKPVSLLRILLLQAMLESVLLRQDGYTPYLICEAVQSLSTSMSSILLRILNTIIAGVCDPHRISRQVFLYLGEEELQRAITWIEAILDAHLTSFAIEAVHQEGVRRALLRTMEVLQGAGPGLEQMEGLMGHWMHIERVLIKKGSHVQTLDALYQIERVNL